MKLRDSFLEQHVEEAESMTMRGEILSTIKLTQLGSSWISTITKNTTIDNERQFDGVTATFWNLISSHAADKL